MTVVKPVWWGTIKNRLDLRFLKKRLLDNGISNKELEEFMQPPKEVG